MAKSYAQYDTAGSGDSVDLDSNQTITGQKTITGTTAINAVLTQAPSASASGNRTLYTMTRPADLARTTATEQTDFYLDLSATVTFATGALATQRAARIAAPTYAFVGASTITNAVTFEVSGAPVAGTNATITNSYAFRVAAGASYLAGATTIAAAATIAPSAGASGVRTALTLTGAADTGLTAATEQKDVYLNLARNVTWAAGAGPLAAQRAIHVAAPTYVGNAGGALTITAASTFYIDAAPAAGANMTLTNAYALFVDAGRVRFDGAVVLNDYPVVQSTGTDGAPVTTINTPRGITTIANGATSVSVTCAACTANTFVDATIRNATTNNVTIRAVIPGSGSFVVHLSGDPGASGAVIGVQITQPGSGT